MSLADYAKLVSLLGKAFDGTAQLGASLPVYYDEYGVQSQIPADEGAAYTNLAAPGGATPSPRPSRPTTTAGRSTSRTASRR